MSKRIQITREDFIGNFIKVDKAPANLMAKLEKPPFCHLLSTYVIRPVACDEQPFLIQHKNKQPVIVSQKKNVVRRPKAQEVSNFSDGSDDDFATVVSDKKRVKDTAPVSAPVVAEVNPQFPASDPSKVIVIDKKGGKKVEAAPVKAPIVRNSEAKPKAIAVEQKAEQVITRAAPAEKAKPEAPKKSAAKPAAEKAAADNAHADMMRSMFGGAPAEAKPAAAQAAPAEKPKQQPKKNANQEQKQEQAKPQSAAPKKERKAAPAKEEKKGGQAQQAKKEVVSMDALLSETDKNLKDQKATVKKVKQEAQKVDQNDFAAAFGAASQLNEEQDRLKKVGKAARNAKK